MPTRRFVTAAIALLCASPAGADTLTATLGTPLREVSHGVDVRRRDGVATYTVRRSFANPGKRHEEAKLSILLPEGAAATGLRIRAGKRWYRGELMEAAAAEALYMKLTGMGPHSPRDPALLQWVSHDELHLQVFPVPPGKTATVEYTLTVPTSYDQGRLGMDYPAASNESNMARPVVRVFARSASARITLDGKLVAAAQPVILPRVKVDSDGEEAADRAVPIRVTPTRISTLRARLGRVVAKKDQQYSRLEVDVAPRLGTVPKRPNVVFVVDASHSVGPRGIEAQLTLMRSFWSHVPDARVEVVLYRRKASRLFSGFVDLKTAERRLLAAGADRRLAPGNGSNLDAGIGLAVQALEGAGKKRGRGYLVMLGDGRLRMSFDNQPSLRTLARAPRGTVTHVVLASPGSTPEDERDDGHDLSPLAARRGGVLLEVTGISSAKKAKEPLRRITEGLVRPVRIDHFQIRGFTGEGFEEIPDTINEGDGLREMKLLAAAPRRLVLSGKVWARSFSRTVRASRSFCRTTAALVFSLDQHGALDEKEMMKVARLGRVVSPVTSYLAIEPGVRPSTEGLGRLIGSAFGDAYGIGGLGMVGTGRGGGGWRNDMYDEVGPVVQRCKKAHKPAHGWSAVLSVETTIHEIVDVKLKTSPPALRRCIVEGTWKVRLPTSYVHEHHVYQVPLSS